MWRPVLRAVTFESAFDPPALVVSAAGFFASIFLTAIWIPFFFAPTFCLEPAPTLHPGSTQSYPTRVTGTIAFPTLTSMHLFSTDPHMRRHLAAAERASHEAIEPFATEAESPHRRQRSHRGRSRRVAQ